MMVVVVDGVGRTILFFLLLLSVTICGAHRFDCCDVIALRYLSDFILVNPSVVFVLIDIKKVQYNFGINNSIVINFGEIIICHQLLRKHNILHRFEQCQNEHLSLTSMSSLTKHKQSLPTECMCN